MIPNPDTQPSDSDLKEKARAPEIAAGKDSDTAKLPSLPQVGSMLGKYQLVSQLGAGWMSIVFKARDTELGRDVAIKLLLPHPGAELNTARFQQEARAASQLSHTNIIDVYDYNVTADGVPYIVLA